MAKVTDNRRGIVTQKDLEQLQTDWSGSARKPELSHAQMAEKLGISQNRRFGLRTRSAASSARRIDSKICGDIERVSGRTPGQRNKQAEGQAAKSSRSSRKSPTCRAASRTKSSSSFPPSSASNDRLKSEKTSLSKKAVKIKRILPSALIHF